MTEIGGNRSQGGVALFDSGVGGLTVLRHFLEIFPELDFTYLGDMARFPYGTKSRETILRFARENVLFLNTLRPSLIVAACFTVSSQVLPELSREFPDVPIVGVLDAGARAACNLTRTGSVGVLATEGTISSQAYPLVIRELSGNSVHVYGQACPLFAPMVEEGVTEGPIAELVARKYLEPFLNVYRDVDTIILGCTHYPPLRKTLETLLPGVVFVDPGQELAREFLRSGEIGCRGSSLRERRFYVTDSPERFVRIGENLLGQQIRMLPEVLTLPDPPVWTPSPEIAREVSVKEDGRPVVPGATVPPGRRGAGGR
ncbi:MAG: glutamate racemase [Nitrospirae bacterium]|nr:glutamate racemase [Nitrospirota bacterium]